MVDKRILAGMLWQMYDITKDEKFRVIAEECENKLDRAFDVFNGLQHDVGFMRGDSAVGSYTLTGNERSFIRAKHAATLLAGRFNLYSYLNCFTCSLFLHLCVFILWEET